MPRFRLLLPSLVLLLGLPWLAQAVLSDAQYAQLHTDITVTNQAEFAAAVTASDDQAIADAYNLLASPVYWVWKTHLTDQEIYEVTTTENTVWDWSTFIGQPSGEREGWIAMYRPGVCNPSLPQTRAGWSKIFHGGGASATQLTHLLTIGRRYALRIEALLVVSGNGSTSTPAVMGYEGQLRPIDVAHALRGVPLP